MSDWVFDDGYEPREASPEWRGFADAVVQSDVEAAARLLGAHPELADDYDLFVRVVRRGLAGLAAACLRRNPHFVGWHDATGHTALMVAAAEGHLEVVRLLVEAGADPDEVVYDYVSGDGNRHSAVTALALALSHGRGEVAEYLAPLTEPWLRKRAGPDPTGLRADEDLFAATTQGRPDRVKAALARGADPRAWFDRGHHTPLHFAAEDGEEEVARLLVEAGADVNTRTAEGETPLELADRVGYPAVVRLLRDAGAVEWPRDSQG